MEVDDLKASLLTGGGRSLSLTLTFFSFSFFFFHISLSRLPAFNRLWTKHGYCLNNLWDIERPSSNGNFVTIAISVVTSVAPALPNASVALIEVRKVFNQRGSLS